MKRPPGRHVPWPVGQVYGGFDGLPILQPKILRLTVPKVLCCCRYSEGHTTDAPIRPQSGMEMSLVRSIGHQPGGS